MGPGIHTISAEDYHADPCGRPSLSASVAHLLLTKSPLHAYTIHPRLGGQRVDDREERFDVGTATHAVVLEGDVGLARLIEVDAKDWKKKDAQEERAAARADGKTPLLAYQYRQVLEMASSVRMQLEGRADRGDLVPPMFKAGKPEQMLVWEDRGVLCRALVDWLHDDLSGIDDLKTTGRTANPREWTRTTMWNIGSDVQVAFNLRGLRAVGGSDDAFFRYCVGETTPPFATSIVSLAPDALALANAKVDRALDLWRRCIETGDWPGYPLRVCHAELPPWTEARWLEQVALEEMGAEVEAA